jgi:HK97 family phage major capsid protein
MSNLEKIKSGIVSAVEEKLLSKADALALETATSTITAQGEQITSQAEQLKSMTLTLDEVKNIAADLESKAAQPILTGEKNVEATFNTKALNEKLREVFTGEKRVELGKLDTKALTIGGAGDAQLAIDQELGRVVIERAREQVTILGLISNKTVSSVDYREMVLRAYPTTAAQGEQTGGTGNGTVFGQTGTATYEQVAMTVAKQLAKPLISNEAINDPHIDLFAMLQVLLTEEVSRYWALQVLFGTGSIGGNDLRGILFNHATAGRLDKVKSITDASTRDFNYYSAVVSGTASIGASDPTAANNAIDNAINLTVELPTKYLGSARFVMNRRTLGEYRKLKDTQGRPLIQFESGAFNLVGYPVSIEDYMPDADGTSAGPNSGTDTFPVIFGDLSKAYALCSIDDNYLVDPYSADSAVMIKMESRKGDIVQNNDAIVVLVSLATWV